MENDREKSRALEPSVQSSEECDHCCVLILLLLPGIIAGGTEDDESKFYEHFIDRGRQSSLRALTIDPLNPTTLYASTSKGVFKSIDSGEHWTDCGLVDQYVETLTVDPKKTSTLYSVADDAIYRSVDGGKYWNKVWGVDKPGEPQANTLAINPKNSMTIYAGTDDGVLKSTDSGESWRELTRGYVYVAMGSNRPKHCKFTLPILPASIPSGFSHTFIKQASGLR